MKYLLDSNAWINHLNYPQGQLTTRMRSHPTSDLYLCAVVIGELRTGAYKSVRRAANLTLIDLLQQQYVSLPYDDVAADQYARIRAALEIAGTPIGPYDTQIAGIAVAHGLTVVTNNTSEFRRVTGLLLEDWSIP